MEKWIQFFNDLNERKEVLLFSLVKTLELAATVSVTGLMMGMLLFFLYVNGNRPLREIIKSYNSFFVGTPLLVWLFIVYYGLPKYGIRMSSNMVAIIGFTLNVGAYNCSYLISSYNGIQPDEIRSATVQGFKNIHKFLCIILPQSFQAALPSLTNQVINNLKDTTIVFLIGFGDLFSQIQEVASSNFLFFRAYIFSWIIYFIIIVSVIGVSKYIERKYSAYRV